MQAIQLGIAAMSQIPIRENASNKSQMVSQLLFGETYQVLQVCNTEWLHIECHYDNYQGFISANQHTPLAQMPKNSVPITNVNDFCLLKNEAYLLSAGCSLPNFCNNTFQINDFKGTFPQANFLDQQISIQQNIENLTKKWLNAPYLWGGRSIFGVDCSGFTQIIFKILHLKLPRDAYQQAELGETIYFVQEAQCGDLAFFDNQENRITHVGIVLPNNQIIHASGKVKINLLDHKGIFCEQTQKYTHQLRVIKRILPNK